MAGIKIKTLKPQKLAYLEHTGDYGSIPYDEYFNRLYEWAKEKNVRPGFKGLGILHDDPQKIPPQDCRSEICIPIVGDAESEGDIKIKELPSMEVAVIKHKGSSKEYPETYKKLNEWIIENGYEWAGPTMEVYTKKPRTKGEETIIYANVQAPVKKKVLLRKLAEKEEAEEPEKEES
ncbi:MAG: GyrI-like domain-containing protein [Thermoplasmata archaeon]|nr:MAG: GyrI-like domain-containing protein [Thermoplasmata archaeon]